MERSWDFVLEMFWQPCHDEYAHILVYSEEEVPSLSQLYVQDTSFKVKIRSYYIFHAMQVVDPLRTLLCQCEFWLLTKRLVLGEYMVDIRVQLNHCFHALNFSENRLLY